MSFLKKLDWDHVLTKLFYAMATLIALSVANKMDKLTNSVEALNIEMRGVAVQLANNSKVNDELKERSDNHAKMLYNHEVRIQVLEGQK